MADAPDNRQGLIEAGRVQFLAKGYGGTSVDAICQQAGVTKGAFFHHFKSKDEFASAVLKDTWQPVVDAHEAAAASDDPRASLANHIRYMVDWICDSGRLMPMMAQELGPSNPDISGQVRGYFETWMGYLVDRLEAAGSGSVANTQSLKDFVVATTEGVPIVQAQFGEKAKDNAADNLVTAVLVLLDS